MTCDFYIMPRRSGKTTSILEEYLKDPYNTFVMTDTQIKVNRIIGLMKEQFPEQTSKLTGALLRRQFRVCDSNSLRGFEVKKILLDDYLMWPSNAREYFQFNLGYSIKEGSQIIVYTTSSRLYHRNIYLRLKKLKEKKESVYEFINQLKDKLKEEAGDLYNNLLTEPFTTIITRDLIIPTQIITDKNELIEKVKKSSWVTVSLNYQISDPLLEEFFEFIYWPYYFALNDISDIILNNFNKVFKKFKHVSRYNINKTNVEKEVLESMKNSCNLGLLFKK